MLVWAKCVCVCLCVHVYLCVCCFPCLRACCSHILCACMHVFLRQKCEFLCFTGSIEFPWPSPILCNAQQGSLIGNSIGSAFARLPLLLCQRLTAILRSSPGAASGPASPRYPWQPYTPTDRGLRYHHACFIFFIYLFFFVDICRIEEIIIILIVYFSMSHICEWLF